MGKQFANCRDPGPPTLHLLHTEGPDADPPTLTPTWRSSEWASPAPDCYDAASGEQGAKEGREQKWGPGDSSFGGQAAWEGQGETLWDSRRHAL